MCENRRPMRLVGVMLMALPLAVMAACMVCAWHPGGLDETCVTSCDNGFAIFTAPGYNVCEGDGSEFVCHQNDSPTRIYQTYSTNSNPGAACGSCIWAWAQEWELDVYECWTDDTDCGG